MIFKEHDIAVLELAQPVPLSDQVHTICLANKEMRKPPDGTNVAVAGWGFTKAFGGSKFNIQYFQGMIDITLNRHSSDSANVAIHRFVCGEQSAMPRFLRWHGQIHHEKRHLRWRSPQG